MMKRLLAPPDGRPVQDLHFGVVSAQLTIAQLEKCADDPLVRDGLLLVPIDLPPLSWPASEPWPPATPYLSIDMAARMDLGRVAAGWVGAAPVSWSCRWPQFMEAVVAAVDGRNPGFVRDDSLLAVLMIGLREDCSTRDPSLWGTGWYEGKCGPDSCCYIPAPDGLLQPVSHYVSALPAAHAQGSLLVLVAGHPGQPEFLDLGPPIGLLIQKSCLGITSVLPSVRLAQLVQGLQALGDERVGAHFVDLCPMPAGAALEAAFDEFADKILNRLER